MICHLSQFLKKNGAKPAPKNPYMGRKAHLNSVKHMLQTTPYYFLRQFVVAGNSLVRFIFFIKRYYSMSISIKKIIRRFFLFLQ